ncbi:uncharacterized protein LOC135399578 [Ornithodoros turicata]|uniref:uncharacterized protein LOC135399578 n=1 Tax=Ornithodoros turicata TaxID=34597 RepID=UPI0031387500
MSNESGQFLICSVVLFSHDCCLFQYLAQARYILKMLQSRRHQTVCIIGIQLCRFSYYCSIISFLLTRQCPTRAYLAQAQHFLKMLTRLYHGQPPIIIGVRHRNITQRWIQ